MTTNKNLTKPDKWNCENLACHKLISTDTTREIIENLLFKRLKANGVTNDHTKTKLNFFWDRMLTKSQDVDVGTILRITQYDVIYACSQSSADFVTFSQLLDDKHTTTCPFFFDYINRKLQQI